MTADKKLIFALINRERQLFDLANALESAGVTAKNLGAQSDTVLLAFGVKPDPLSDELPDIIFDGFEAGDSTEEIYERLTVRIGEINR
ncbi:MAG: hypothetical protein K9M45_07800 [Kiritimatiellales bacterium]|nr:hypothetical protein [Kiritimatiellales bacterium]